MSVSIDAEKSRLRSHFLRLRRELAPDEKQNAEAEIRRRLYSCEGFKSARTVLIYASSPIEVDTLKIISDALKSGKNVAAPRCKTEACEMDFYLINSLSELEAGAYKILEPDIKICRRLENFDNAVCIIPALSYDIKGYRLGFGKGYYDRFLSGFGGTKIGLCFESCIKHDLPRGEYDRKADIIVTDEQIRII